MHKFLMKHSLSLYIITNSTIISLILNKLRFIIKFSHRLFTKLLGVSLLTFFNLDNPICIVIHSKTQSCIKDLCYCLILDRGCKTDEESCLVLLIY